MERSNDIIQFQVYKGAQPKPYMSYNVVGKKKAPVEQVTRSIVYQEEGGVIHESPEHNASAQNLQNLRYSSQVESKEPEETNPHTILNEDNPFKTTIDEKRQHSFASKTTAVDISKPQFNGVRRSRRVIMDARNATAVNCPQRGSQQQRGSQSTNPALFSDEPGDSESKYAAPDIMQSMPMSIVPRVSITQTVIAEAELENEQDERTQKETSQHETPRQLR